jgi:hypothetical protein
LRDEGYEVRPPSAEVAAQDEGMCRRMTCASCRRPGLRYRPYVLPKPESGRPRYRAVAVCVRCAEAIEF